jgi:hypothetical protein
MYQLLCTSRESARDLASSLVAYARGAEPIVPSGLALSSARSSVNTAPGHSPRAQAVDFVRA